MMCARERGGVLARATRRSATPPYGSVAPRSRPREDTAASPGRRFIARTDPRAVVLVSVVPRRYLGPMNATYLVTGASRGLGAEFVRQLREQGHSVVAAVRDPD